MLAKTLVDREIDEGKRLVDALKDAGLSPTAALWYFAAWMDQWRLMISLPMVDTEYHRGAFAAIDRVRKQMQPPASLELSDIAVQSTHSPLISAIRRKMKGTGVNAGFCYVGERVGGDFIEDAYVYFLRR